LVLPLFKSVVGQSVVGVGKPLVVNGGLVRKKKKKKGEG
jgi:hypothetical protein